MTNEPILDIELVVRDGVIYYDSRLLAAELDIAHHALMQLIRKYQAEIEEDFGPLQFDTAESKGRGQPEKFCWLTEEVVYYLTTQVKNSPYARKCTRKIIQGFINLRNQLIVTQVELAKQREINKLNEGIRYKMFRKAAGDQSPDEVLIEIEQHRQVTHIEFGTIDKYLALHPERNFDSPTFDLRAFVDSIL